MAFSEGLSDTPSGARSSRASARRSESSPPVDSRTKSISRKTRLRRSLTHGSPQDWKDRPAPVLEASVPSGSDGARAIGRRTVLRAKHGGALGFSEICGSHSSTWVREATSIPSRCVRTHRRPTRSSACSQHCLMRRRAMVEIRSGGSRTASWRRLRSLKVGGGWRRWWASPAWDQNAGLYVCGPSAAVVEEVAGAWVAELLGLPAGVSFGFVTGSQMAHVTALAGARHSVFARVGWDVNDRGLIGAPAVHVVVGEERHATVEPDHHRAGLGLVCGLLLGSMPATGTSVGGSRILTSASTISGSNCRPALAVSWSRAAS